MPTNQSPKSKQLISTLLLAIFLGGVAFITFNKEEEPVLIKEEDIVEEDVLFGKPKEKEYTVKLTAKNESIKKIIEEYEANNDTFPLVNILGAGSKTERLINFYDEQIKKSGKKIKNIKSKKFIDELNKKFKPKQID